MSMTISIVPKVQARKIMRTEPPLGMPAIWKPDSKRIMKPSRKKIIYALVHPNCAVDLDWNNQFTRFPTDISEIERVKVMEEGKRLMNENWARTIIDVSGNQDAFFMFIPGSTLSRSRDLLKLAEHKFGDRLVHVEYGKDIEARSVELAQRIGEGSKELWTMGEFTTRCEVDISARIAVAMRINWDDVVIMREMSVDTDHEKYGDPFSPTEKNEAETLASP